MALGAPKPALTARVNRPQPSTLHQALTVLGLDLLGGAALGASDTTICTPPCTSHTRTGGPHSLCSGCSRRHKQAQ